MERVLKTPVDSSDSLNLRLQALQVCVWKFSWRGSFHISSLFQDLKVDLDENQKVMLKSIDNQMLDAMPELHERWNEAQSQSSDLGVQLIKHSDFTCQTMELADNLKSEFDRINTEFTRLKQVSLAHDFELDDAEKHLTTLRDGLAALRAQADPLRSEPGLYQSILSQIDDKSLNLDEFGQKLAQQRADMKNAAEKAQLLDKYRSLIDKLEKSVEALKEPQPDLRSKQDTLERCEVQWMCVVTYSAFHSN